MRYSGPNNLLLGDQNNNETGNRGIAFKITLDILKMKKTKDQLYRSVAVINNTRVTQQLQWRQKGLRKGDTAQELVLHQFLKASIKIKNNKLMGRRRLYYLNLIRIAFANAHFIREKINPFLFEVTASLYSEVVGTINYQKYFGKTYTSI